MMSAKEHGVREILSRTLEPMEKAPEAPEGESAKRAEIELRAKIAAEAMTAMMN